MSEIGGQLGFYEELQEQAELVDGVLLELKSSEISRVKTGTLGTMLVSLGTESWQSSPGRLILILLGDFSRQRRRRWVEIGERLLSGHVSNGEVQTLEKLATALEAEQVSVMSRITGL
ncbi:MAG: hypothetical protein ABL984_10245 [Pyrinomonadaceae bacterium]